VEKYRGNTFGERIKIKSFQKEIRRKKLKRILITGGTGSWGHELTRQLLRDDQNEIIIYTRGEQKQVEMKREFYDFKDRMYFIIGDVRNYNRLLESSLNVDTIYHLAALKHVPVCEENPWETILTNITGTNNVIQAAKSNSVNKVVFVSTDKAVDPLNVYGTSKSMAEKMFVAANRNSHQTRFICIRAGNVLGTNGSVIPLFREQIIRKNVITITHPDMTRFFIRVGDAIKLVLKAKDEAVGGEIFVAKMPSTHITDLAKVMIKHFGNDKTGTKDIGIRPGEKVHEVLVSRYEASRTIDLDKWYIVLPMILIQNVEEKYDRSKYKYLEKEYSSKDSEKLSFEGIEKLLQISGFLDVLDEKELTTEPEDLLDLFRKEGWLR
jgi:FlaA1/EpsC-like NDP-sugar epimerase